MKKALIIGLFLSCYTLAFGQGPTINVWYGDSQKFGHLGTSQKWANILGNVADPDGVKKLSYTLNDGEEFNLSVGPDGRRLENKGDFNIDILLDELENGDNTVIISATDSLDETNSKVVTVQYEKGKKWSYDYLFEWDTVTNIQNVVQVVDGKWEITSEGVRTSETGYDRLIAIGDTSWNNYEVEIPVTIHQIEPPISEFGGADYGLGLIMRWKGHTDNPVAGWQPKAGFLPLGEIGWFNWPQSNINDTQLNFFNTTKTNRNSFQVDNGVTYIFKFQVYTIPQIGHFYKLKVWPDTDSEPTEWTIENERDIKELANGSFLLVAHHVDATFGNPKIRALNQEDGYGVRITEAVDEGIPCYKIETVEATYYYDKAGGGFTSIIDEDGNDWISYTQGGGSAGEYRGVPNTGELHPGYVGGVTVSPNTPGIWHDSVSLQTTRNGETATWEFFPTFAKMTLNEISESDDKYWVLYEGTPGGAIEDSDSIYTSNGISFSAFSDNPFGDNDIVNTSGIALGSEWMYVKDGSIDRSFYMAITDDEVSDNYFELDNNMTVFGFGRKQGPAVQLREDVGANVVIGFSNSKENSIIQNRLNSAWNKSINNLPDAGFDYVIDENNPLKVILDASASTDSDGIIENYAWNFGDGNIGMGLVTSHTFAETGSYNIELVITDNSGGKDSIDYFIYVNESGLAFSSDDFDTTQLNNNIWTFINPIGDGNYTFEGYDTGSSTLTLHTPANTNHDVWTEGNRSVRIMQSTVNKDFRLETKFESLVSKKFQSQGIIVEQDTNKYIRFDFYSDGKDVYVFAATFTNGNPTVKVNSTFDDSSASSLFMRVSRTNNDWLMEYSIDSLSWQTGTSFHFPMILNEIGAFSGNSGVTPPVNNTIIDYFFNLDDPILPEDKVSNRPKAKISYEPDTLNSAKIHFDASDSWSPASTLTDFVWDFGDGSMGNGETTSHTYQASGTYEIQLTITDADGLQGFKTIEYSVTVLDDQSDIVSDDFSDDMLRDDIWQFINPAGDGTYQLVSERSTSYLQLSVPEGTRHEVWEGIFTPIGVLQACSNTNFEIEVKFESVVSKAFQEQGILIMEDNDKLLRLEIYSDSIAQYLLIAKFQEGIPTIIENKKVELEGSSHLKVTRKNNAWTIDYSDDGENWHFGSNFLFAMDVSSVGPYGGNAGKNPAHTVKVDYFFNNDEKIEPEDPNSITSLDKKLTLETVKVYPNPAETQINLSYSIPSAFKVSINLFDTKGVLVKDIKNAYQEPGNHTETIPLSNIEEGLYFLKINFEDGSNFKSITKKFFIQNH